MHEQQLSALEVANLTRLARGAVRRGLATGALSLTDALINPYVQSARVADVIDWVPGYGAHRTRRVLAKASVSEYAYVQNITERQRAVLSEWVA